MNEMPFFDRQIASWAAKDPQRFGELEGVEIYFTDPKIISFWKAASGKRTNDPAIIQSLCSKNGWRNATIDEIKKILTFADDFPPANVGQTVDELRSLYGRRKSKEALKLAMDQLDLGKMTIGDVETFITDTLGEYVEVDDAHLISNEDWATFGPMEAARRRDLLASGKMPKFSRRLPTLRNLVKREPSTLQLIVGESGAGKSALAEMDAEAIAEDTGDVVLYGLTELTKAQAMWRSIARRTGISYESLSNGFWSDQCSEAVKPLESGGRVVYFECGGLSLQAILGQAKKLNAHIVIDYWDMIRPDIPRMLKNLQMTKTDAIGDGLMAVKAYVQQRQRMAIVVQQYGKEGTNKGKGATAMDAMDSSRFRHRANLALVLKFERMQEDTKMPHAYLRDPENPDKMLMLDVNEGSLNPYGYIRLDKETFGGKEGKRVKVFRDGSRFSFVETATVEINKK